jgi:hypothetical protein
LRRRAGLNGALAGVATVHHLSLRLPLHSGVLLVMLLMMMLLLLGRDSPRLLRLSHADLLLLQSHGSP